jgi:hypothetical protein
MATTIDPDDLAAIEKLAVSGLWQRAGLVESFRLQEEINKQKIVDALTKLRGTHPEAAQPEEPVPDLSRLTEIERELIEDILTLFDDNGLSQEQTLSLLGQVSVLIDLVKRGQAQRNS